MKTGITIIVIPLRATYDSPSAGPSKVRSKSGLEPPCWSRCKRFGFTLGHESLLACSLRLPALGGYLTFTASHIQHQNGANHDSVRSGERHLAVQYL